MSELKAYQHSFIALAIRSGVLQFGEFTLKSGRVSPYFFNVGKISSGADFAGLGAAYAARAAETDIPFDALFGPAYKGIPIATAMAVAMARDFGRNLSVTFDRKEAKDHGEGGVLIGAAVTARMLVVDDVIADGKAKLQSAELIRAAGGQVAGVLVALDRQERGAGQQSAVKDVAEKLGVPVLSIINLHDLLTYLENEGRTTAVAAIKKYRETYGAD